MITTNYMEKRDLGFPQSVLKKDMKTIENDLKEQARINQKGINDLLCFLHPGYNRFQIFISTELIKKTTLI